VATTKTAAECLGWEDRLGTVEPGKLADLVLVATDPLADIRALEDPRTIEVVWQGGEIAVDRRVGSAAPVATNGATRPEPVPADA
jgi:imidazolonepropionase-like amidohydrolase